MENNTKQVQDSVRHITSSISEKGASSEDLLTSTVSLRTNEVLEHLGIHYAHENPLVLQRLQEEEGKKQAQKAKEELLYQTLNTNETQGDTASGQNAVFEAAGLLSKLGIEADKNTAFDEQVNEKVNKLNTNNLLTQEKLVDAFVKYMKSINDNDWWGGNNGPEGNWQDFEQMIQDLKAWFKGNPQIETMLNNIQGFCHDNWGQFWNDPFMGWNFGGYFYQIFKNQVMPQLESILEKAMEMPSPFQRVLNEEMEKLEKENNQASQFFLALQIKVAEGGKHSTGQNAIFESAALVSDVADDAETNEINNLQKRLVELRMQLQHLVKMEKLLNQFTSAVQQFEKTHDFGDFFKVLLTLFSEFGKNPGVRKELNQILKQGIGAFVDSKMMNWWFGNNNYIWNQFADSIVSTFDNIEKTNMDDPALAELYISQGKAAFDKVINKALKQISELEQIIHYIEEDHGEKAIFMMEEIVMQLEAVALKKNANQNKIQEKESEANILALKQTLTKITAALKKLEKAEHHHHHGIFGWIEDAFDAIAHVLADIGKLFAHVVTGNFAAAGNDLKDLSKGLKMYAKFFEALAKGHVLQAFEIFEAVMISAMLTGGIGLIATNSQFTKDIQNGVKLVVDAVRAFVQLLGAGLMAALGQEDLASKIMKSDKKLGIDMLENPALKPLMDVAMVVVICLAVAAQQYWLAGIMTVMLVMSDFGVMDKITGGIAKLFEDMGVSDKVAKVLADVTVVIIVTALTLGAGSLDASGEEVGELAAESSGEGGEENAPVKDEDVAAATIVQQVGAQVVEAVSQNAANAANNAADQVAQEEENFLARAARAIGETVGKRGGAALTGFGISFGSTSFGVDLAKAIDSKDKELMEILEIVQAVMAAIAAAVGGAGMAFGGAAEGATSSAAESSSSITDGIRKIIPKLADYIEQMATYMDENAEELTQLASKALRVSMVTQGVGQGMEGGLEMLKGDYLEELSKEKGFFQAIQAFQQINNAQIQQTDTHRGALIKEFDKWNDELIKAPGLVADAQYQVMSQNIV
ncbi:MAG: hypothetical protein KFB93_02945 [Simkaniaceae bacterium]|nr:MAG: hypothetical protein KFB93_02945 [Simkaniaceae bacterium]